MSDGSGKKFVRLLLPLAALWLFLAGLLLLSIWPEVPRSKMQWVLFIALGPPIYVLGEGLFGWLFSPAHGRAISKKAFSLARIAIALLVALGVFAIGWWLT
jgi:hypothetical protein